MRQRLARSSLRFVLCAAILAALPLPLLAADHTATLRLELDPRGRFAVENLAGTMTVVPTGGSRVVAVATVHAESDALLRSLRFEQVKGDHGVPTLRVIYPIDDHDTFRYPGSGEGGGFLSRMFGGGSNTTTKYAGRRVRVSGDRGVTLYADVEVQVPARADATFRNVVGRITAERLEGKLSFDTGSGDIVLTDMMGSISADTGSGDIIADRIDGDFNGDTGSGEIHLTQFDGDTIRCDTGSGDIRIESARARSIEADTGSGDIRVERASAVDLSADTGSGDIFFEGDGADLDHVMADTGTGDITLVLGPDASFEARADIGSGEIECRYTDADAILRNKRIVGFRRGGGRTRIQADTGSGDLILMPGR